MTPTILDVAFRDPQRAAAQSSYLDGLLAIAAARNLQAILHTLADPDAVLQLLARLAEEQPAALQVISADRQLLHLFATVASHSEFLGSELLQHPEWLTELADLGEAHTRRGFLVALANLLPTGVPEPLLLAQFRRQQLLRILLRDVLDRATLAETTIELSDLADAVLEFALVRLERHLAGRHGEPATGFSVLALGKLGGRELNYSSDIDLMFVYGENGMTTGLEPITYKEFYKKIANQLTGLLSTYTVEGLCYRVDLRLRPDGRLGELSLSVEGMKQYYTSRGRDWELQMLIKARVAAGDPATGQRLLDFVEPRIYGSTLNFSAVEAMSETRERINEKLQGKRRSEAGHDIKLMPGGIRDIEFLVQCLQRLHGGRELWVRAGGTQLALMRLRDRQLLSAGEYAELTAAYTFLRVLEHRLQADQDRQTHALPRTPEELALLARRMPVREMGTEQTAAGLLEQVRFHTARVIEAYERVVHGQQAARGRGAVPNRSVEQKWGPPAPSFRTPAIAGAFQSRPLRGGSQRMGRWRQKLQAEPQLLAAINEDDALAGYVFDLFEYSPYLSEWLMRQPDLLAELRALRAEERFTATDTAPAGRVSDPGELRRLYQREMFRVQCASLCLSEPVFATLAVMSDLADAVIGAAYRMAVQQTIERHPPLAGYVPQDQLLVIALGRLGLREFDLSSDADLLFVLQDAHQGHREFWTHAAENLIEILSAYTREGAVLTVDTRLRPYGNAGSLVQTEQQYRDYFGQHAATWEGISYLKARAVAGNCVRATAFLTELQEIDWRRYGQNGRSKADLREMRLRLEKEQGTTQAMKAGPGGFYDIDFALLYLRLKGAGLFFPVLNTPERIDIVEKMGHLEKEDAEFLRQAVIFFRAIDHALRLYQGHTAGALPQSDTALASVSGLVCRWTGRPVNPGQLPVEFAAVQKRTRELFDRIFQ